MTVNHLDTVTLVKCVEWELRLAEPLLDMAINVWKRH
jgi:hypothetical protein